MKKRIVIAVLSVCTALCAGCGAKTVYALEPTETVEETEVMVTESMEATATVQVAVTEVETENATEVDTVIVNGFEMVKHAIADLDGDGIEEKITFDGRNLHVK